MKLVILAIGKGGDDPAVALAERYLERCSWRIDLQEFTAKKARQETARADEERRLIEAAIPKGAYVVALDERGRDMRSLDFARVIAALRDENRMAVFLLGGATGLGEALRARADLVLRFGAQTWPHLLARAMLAEQLYRASAILNGHPYHREG